MQVSEIISLFSGIALFLFGMTLMGDGLKKVAGSRLELVLYRLSNTPLKGLLLGTGVTAVIQSSCATSVMVVGFVNSGMMKVRQAFSVILGAILGTSVTGWVISLSYVGDGGDPGQGRGGQQPADAGARAEIAQADDPAGDAGAQDGAEDDTDRLPQLHHAGVHETDHHDRGRAGGLDRRGDAGAEQHPPEGRAGQAVQDQLQAAARHLLEPVAHQRHAEQEQRDPAEQGNDLRDPHSDTPFKPARRGGRGAGSVSVLYIPHPRAVYNGKNIVYSGLQREKHRL